MTETWRTTFDEIVMFYSRSVEGSSDDKNCRLLENRVLLRGLRLGTLLLTIRR